MSPGLALGVAVVVAGNICVSIALNVQKLAHLRSDPGGSNARQQDTDEEAGERSLLLPDGQADGRAGGQDGRQKNARSGGDSAARPYWRMPLWWIGVTTMAVGELGNFIAYAFAPATVVAPLGTVALVSNCFVAPWVLGETFDKKDLMGVVLAIIGAVAVVMSGTGGDDELLSPEALQRLIAQAPFIIYTCVNVGLIVCFTLLSRTKHGARFVVIDVGLCALLGSWTVISTKSFSSFLSLLFLRCFTYWITWVALLILVPTAVLQRFDSTQVVPIQFTLFILASISGSAVLFGDFRSTEKGQLLNFGLGVVLILAGVWLLNQHEADTPIESEGSTDPPPQPQAEGTPPRRRRPPLSSTAPSADPMDITPRRRSHAAQHRMPSFSAGSLLLPSPRNRGEAAGKIYETREEG